jgi:hypothetical protein
MVDLLLAATAVVVLLGVTVVLVRTERLGRGRLGLAIAVIVLAAGTFAVTLYRIRTAPPPVPSGLTVASAAATPAAATSAAAEGLGTAVLRVEVPMGSGDKLPQGALWLDPPRPGTDAYTGDVSLLCSTPGRSDSEQNCDGTAQRVWSIEPLGKRVVLGPATGDPFADPAACAAANGVDYQAGYLELTAGRGYCLRPAAGGTRVVALRVPAFPTEQPLPAKIVVETAVLSG